MHSAGLPRSCLGFTNMLTFIFGVICLAICVWCAINTEFFREVNYTITKSPWVKTIANFVNLKLWFTPMTSVLIPVACLIIFTSCCGILGAGCKTKCALKSYIFLVTAITLASFWILFVSFIYNIYTNKQTTRNYMTTTLRHYGKENDLITNFWDYVMVNYECCGVNDSRDFIDTDWHKKNLDKLYPVQCCKFANKTALMPRSKYCTISREDVAESFADRGCFVALRESIKGNKRILTFYAVLILLIYLMITSFAFCIIRGEPLIGPIDPEDVMFVPIRRDVEKAVQSQSSLDNMMFVDEPPKKVVQVVSVLNPNQRYTIAPNSLPNSIH
ncbi:tetraspanin-9-like [Leptidea sinapis]|uniref:tetraspanin-9-like n=1 Tax=Leptidea sinapis TaxID=189913 RepID=UPI0021C2F0B8|nr:tetraspanin-9-like [Leptidea sinapis]